MTDEDKKPSTMNSTPSSIPCTSDAISNRILAVQLVSFGNNFRSIIYAEANWLFALELVGKPGEHRYSEETIVGGARCSGESGYRSLPCRERAAFQSFSNSAIHGIQLGVRSVAISSRVSFCAFGDHSLRLCFLNWLGGDESDERFGKMTLGSTSEEMQLDHLVIATYFLQDGRFAAVLANNSLLITNSGLTERQQMVECQDQSILYSAKVLRSTLENEQSTALVLGGTVHNYLCFWAPADAVEGRSPVLHKLHGHSGVIFDMDYNDERRILCSTSDDRSCRVYSVDFESLNQTSVPTLTNWRRAKFTHLHSLFGHEARVWRALILRDSIVTVGEDGRCCVWDDTASLYYSSIVSSGTSIWSLAAEETEDGSLIITGGADGSLVVQHVPRKMRQGISKAVVHRLLSPGANRVRQLAFWDDDHFIVLLDGGYLYSVQISSSLWTSLWHSDELMKCVALACDEALGVVVVVTCDGKISLADVTSVCSPCWLFDLRTNCMEALWVSDKSSSAHHTLITSGSSGFISILRVVVEGKTVVRLQGEIPLQGKNAWVTCGCQRGEIIVCGDRCGSLCVIGNFDVPENLLVERCVHDQSEVSQVSFHGNYLITSGRSGKLIMWNYDFSDTADIFLRKLKVFQVSKQLLEWVSGFGLLPGLSDTSKPCIVAFGFRSTKYLSVNMLSSEKLSEVECGGGNRSSCTALIKNDTSSRFMFVRTTGVHWVDIDLAMRRDRILTLKQPLHGLQIWSVLYLGERHDENEDGYMVFAVASEDTLATIFRIPTHASPVPKLPQVLSVCKGHLSSVRTLAHSVKHAGCFYSGGGRGQLCCWQSTNGFLSGGIVMTSQWSPFPVVRKKWSDQKQIDPDTRIMDMDVCLFKDLEILGACTSDGFATLFIVASPSNLRFIGRAGPVPCCALKMRFVVLEEDLLLLVAGTDGHICMLDLSDGLASRLALDPKDCGDGVNVIKTSDSRKIPCHQSGIDSMDLWMCENSILIATGGDDGAIYVTKFASCRDVLTAASDRCEERNAHCGQVSVGAVVCVHQAHGLTFKRCGWVGESPLIEMKVKMRCYSGKQRHRQASRQKRHLCLFRCLTSLGPTRLPLIEPRSDWLMIRIKCERRDHFLNISSSQTGCYSKSDISLDLWLPSASSTTLGFASGPLLGVQNVFVFCAIHLIESSKVLSAAKDQLIKLWEISLDFRTISMVACVSTSVADVSCTQWYLTNETGIPTENHAGDGNLRGKSFINIAVVGAGFELLKLASI